MVEFIEFPVFVEMIDEYLSEDERREMQNFLLENPETGDVIRSGGGIRKMRWKLGKRGKSGGIRIIYFLKPSNNSIYFLLAYAKSEKSNLSEHQIKTFAKFVKEHL
jgi:hypothetical protein